MEPAFWHERWQHNRIGFHLDEVNPYLIRHWPRLGLAPPGRVFVPLAGKSLDMRWLADKGYEVLGNEISPIAVQAFFEEQGLQTQVRSEGGGMEHWRGGGVTLLCGDFWQLTADDLGAFDVVYDRAALIAVPEAQRPAYVEKMRALVGSVPQLLITLEFDTRVMNGPPFSVLEDEVHGHYAPEYAIEELERRDILAESPKFRERGLQSLYEVVYLLQPR